MLFPEAGGPATIILGAEKGGILPPRLPTGYYSLHTKMYRLSGAALSVGSYPRHCMVHKKVPRLLDPVQSLFSPSGAEEKE